MLLKPNYDVEESFKKTKPAYVGFFIAHSGHPFPPLKPPKNPIQHSEHNDYIRVH